MRRSWWSHLHSSQSSGAADHRAWWVSKHPTPRNWCLGCLDFYSLVPTDSPNLNGSKWWIFNCKKDKQRHGLGEDKHFFSVNCRFVFPNQDEQLKQFKTKQIQPRIRHACLRKGSRSSPKPNGPSRLQPQCWSKSMWFWAPPSLPLRSLSPFGNLKLPSQAENMKYSVSIKLMSWCS